MRSSSRTIRILVCVAFALELLGVWYSAKGVVRESFVELSRNTGGFDLWQPIGWVPSGWQPTGAFDPEAFDPESFGGEIPLIDRIAVGVGLWLGLLPTDLELKPEDRRENARAAVFGVVLLLAGLVLGRAENLWSTARQVKAGVQNLLVRARTYALLTYLRLRRWYR